MLEYVELQTLFDQSLKTSERMRECSFKGVGQGFVMGQSQLTKLSAFGSMDTQILFPGYPIHHLSDLTLHLGIGDLDLILKLFPRLTKLDIMVKIPVDFQVIHPCLRELVLNSGEDERHEQRISISPLTIDLEKLTVRNFHGLKTLDIYAPNIKKVRILDCYGLKKVEITES